MSKKLQGIVSLLLLGVFCLSACSFGHIQGTKAVASLSVNSITSLSTWPFDEQGRRIVPEKDLATYDIVLPAQMDNDLKNLAVFAITTRHINVQNVKQMWCLALLDRSKYDQEYSIDSAFKGTLSGWINSVAANYDGLLCYIDNKPIDKPIITRIIDLFLGYKNTDRIANNLISIVELKKGTPSIVANKYSRAAAPIDLVQDMTGAVQVDFVNGSPSNSDLILPDGTKLNAVINVPEIYTNWYTPTQMQIDLPALNP